MQKERKMWNSRELLESMSLVIRKDIGCFGYVECKDDTNWILYNDEGLTSHTNGMPEKTRYGGYEKH